MTMFWAIIFIVVCILLVIVVLLQKGRGGGLGGILGGGGQSAFGTRTGDVFTWITIVLVGIFLLLAIGATKLFQGGEKLPLPTPVFYPEPKPIAKAIRVTITCNAPKVNIYYTIDGSEPTRKSRKYGTPIYISPDTTLKARAFHRRWKNSDIKIGEYPHPSTTTTGPAATTRPAPAQTDTKPN
ncbi:MAG: preprotein translocase subunit SecG [Phycisphaerae bacterium]|nr:preprotein translocase subunit SecG [Phycisphaerae bacterium]